MADPFRVTPSKAEEEVILKMVDSAPTFSIGFTEQTCLVPPLLAGLAAYNICTNENRVMMQVVNKYDSRGKIAHCIFTDGGCGGFVCPSHANGAWVREMVGKFAIRFVNSIVEGIKTSKADYEMLVSDRKVNVFYGKETATLP